MIMKVAKNMKELEKMILGEMKKKLPSVTREYCHKWYSNATDVKDIVSETEFIQMVNDSLKLSIFNGKVNAQFEIFKDEDIKKEHIKTMRDLWESFGDGYIKHIKAKLFK